MKKPTIPTVLTEETSDLWSAFERSANEHNLSIPQEPSARDDLHTGFAFSRFVAQSCINHPDLAVNLLESGDLVHAYENDHLAQRCRKACSPVPEDMADRFAQPDERREPNRLTEDEFQQKLRRFRHREMVRIAVRDVCGSAELDETMTDLSALADACIQQSLDFQFGVLSTQWGAPLDDSGHEQQLVVLGLGKLGAHELNFSSDIDLIFAYSQNGQTRGGCRGALSNEAFYERLCRNVIRALGAHTAFGFVFRVDMRLRPFGESGPIVMSFGRLEAYYEEQGREWERYALIKARPVAGDIAAGMTLLERLKPFVYRRYLDFGAFDSLREMKGRIVAEVREKGLENNIKLGSGGIREVEFFGQMFQLIRGGVEPDLQVRRIRLVLRLLAKKGHIPVQACDTLDSGYVFLRLVENRLQQWRDQQTHLLPSDDTRRQCLATVMGFDSWSGFEAHLSQLRQQIHHHFDKLLATDKQEKNQNESHQTNELTALWQGVMDTERANASLTRLGYKDPHKVCEEIKSLKEDRTLRTLSVTGRQRLDRLAPLILKNVGSADEPEMVLSRLFDLIKSIQKRTSYLALLLENPTALTHLVRLSGESTWIADFLTRHPVLLDELLDPRTLYRPPRREELADELRQRLSAADEDDLEYQMEILRVFKQVNVLRVAASDITHVLPLMKVSDHLTDIAETILEEVLQICWCNLIRRHGIPICQLEDNNCDRGFVVVGYGKLGGLELGYGSDLDLVFLHAARQGETQGGTRPIDSTQYFGRLGQRVLHMLTTHTSAGKLYEADMRLRPSGSSGMLVSHLDGFAQYQQNDAWTWEHQALIRARAITGDPLLQNRFNQIRHRILTRPRDAGKLRKEVAQMRSRLRDQESDLDPDVFDIKQGKGGIVDIEFIVQYLVLHHAGQYPDIVRWTDNVRLLQALNETGIIDNATAFGLRRAYLIYRAMVHRLNLRQQPAKIKDDRFTLAREFVIDTWKRILGDQK